jgi:lipoyl(octanoyl) transferase
VTYHGPGQLVGYPLIQLAKIGKRTTLSLSEVTTPVIPRVDYVGYLHQLEVVLIESLKRFGITATRRNNLSGVWVQPGSDRLPGKIAAIGVKVDANGVTQHGFALNVKPDMEFWQGIIACGLEGYAVTSLAELLNPPPAMDEVMEIIIKSFGEIFGYTMQNA